MRSQRALWSYGAVALSGSFFEVGGGGRLPEIGSGRGPHQSPCELPARVQSLRLRQRIIISLVQALDFATAEAFIPDLKPCAEGFRYA
jgi:hypothetical protein